MTLTEFLLARIAEDEADYLRARDALAIAGKAIPHARVLAECEAKRTILEKARWAIDVEGGGAEDFASFTLRAFAAVYSDHPDYRDEWRA